MKKRIIAVILAAAMTPAVQASEVTIKLGGGLKAAEKAKELKFQVGGRLMWDYENDQNADGDTTKSEFSIRRARIYVKSQVDDWALKSQFNIDEKTEEEVNNTDASAEDVRADAGGTVEDLYIQYQGFGKGAKVTIGHQRIEFGLEDFTSSNDISFLERNAASEAYAVGRLNGVSLSGDIDGLHYSVAVFEDGEDTDATDTFVSTRAAYAVKSDDSLLHAGLAYHNRDGNGANQDTFGVELAGVAGPFHAQAEYMSQDEDGATDTNDIFYVQLGYVITGETRPYKGGKFKRVKPADASGAYEVVARYVDGYGEFSDVGLSTEEASEYGLGLNYYANKNVRLGINYSVAENDANDEGSEFRARAQFAF